MIPETIVTQSRSSAPAPPPDVPTIPGYEVLEELGRGGMGIVYKARQKALNRLVALKMILAESDIEDRLRFLGEAESVAAIEHPNVVQIHEFGAAEGRPFLVMEFLGGGSLAQHLKECQRLSPGAAAGLVSRIARGVQAAHEVGIVHRDLKPANILLAGNAATTHELNFLPSDTESDTAEQPAFAPALGPLIPKVSDFGIAKRGRTFDLTQTGMALGTPAYMAPEQAGGHSKAMGPTADVHALGVILFECLTGRPPYQGDSPEMIMYRVVQQEPPSVRDLAPIVPRDLELICEKCLAKKPSERYQSASALADDLDRFLAGEPVSVVSPGPIERMGRWIRKHPTRAALYVFVLLTVMFAVFTGVAATLWFDAEHQRQLAENARDMAQLEERRANEEKAAALLATEEAQRQRSLAESARADADYVSAVRSVDLAFREYEFNNPAGAVNLLDGCPTRFRGWEWHAVDRLVSRQTRILRVPGKQLRSLALAPSRTHLAAAGDGMTVWNLDRGQPVASVPNNIRSVAFSRDGKFATVDSKGNIRVADSPTAAGQSFAAPHVGAIEFHPDGTQLISTNRNAVVLIDPVNRKVVKTIGWASGTVAAARYSPNGDRFAAVGLHESFEIQQTKVGEGTRQAIAIRIYDSRSGQVVAENLNLGSEAAYSLSWSSDGKQLAIGAWGRVILLNAASPNQTRTIPVGDRAIPAVAFNADDSLVIGADDKLARVWDSATGQQVDVLQGHSLPVHAVGFASDGTAYTAGDDGTVRFWQVATTPPEVTFSNSEDPPSRVAVSSDGRVLALGGNRSVEIRDTRSGAILKSLPVAAPVRGLTFSADGGRIAVLLRDGSVRHWDWKTGGVQVLPSGPAQPAAATATFDYQKLVLHRDGNIAIVDRITGKTAGEFPNSSQDEPEAIALNREGSRLAAGSSSGTVRLWDARTGEELMRLPGHTTPVKGIAFNPDGTRLATVGSEGWLKVWDTRTGFEVLTLRTRQQPMVAVNWSPDGTKLVVVGGNHARILDATPLR